MPDPQPVRNAVGQIAVKYYQEMQVLVSCPRPDRTRSDYVFSVRAHLSMCWVELRDLPCLQAKEGGCCNHKKKGIITVASQADVDRWNGPIQRGPRYA